jgi:tetratricopeptide (TPR) repeat protein
MRKRKSYILISLSILVFCNCQNKKQNAETVLSILEEKDSTYQDISSDTIVFQVFDYYKRKNDKKKKALAAFYSGRVYQSQKKYKEALEYYLIAQTHAEQINDYDLTGSINFFIGNIYYEQLLIPEAEERLAQSQELTHRYSNNYKREIVINTISGNCYYIEGKIDSTLLYYNKALALAVLHNDSNQQAIIKGNLSVIFRKQGDIENTKRNLLEAIDLDRNKSAKLYLNLAKVFFDENQYDSIYHYTNIALMLAEKEKDITLQSNSYQLLSKLEEKRENYKKAMTYYHQYTTFFSLVLKEKREQDLLIIENKYNYEQTQNKNNQLLIEQQRIYLALLALCIVIIVTGFYFNRKIMKQKTHILTMEKASLETEQQIGALESMADGFNEKEKTLRNEVLSHFEILKKVALLKEDRQFTDKSNYKNSPLERINNIIYGNKKDLNWDLFFTSINTIHNGFIEKINQVYPVLDQWDKKICYLTCMDFNNPEMATLLELALNTIEQKKTNIRKKLQIPDRGNIKEFFIQSLSLPRFDNKKTVKAQIFQRQGKK